MTSRISKGSITGRKAYSDGGLALSVGTRATRGIRNSINRRAPDAGKISGGITIPDYVLFGYASVYDIVGTPAKPYLSKLTISQPTYGISNTPSSVKMFQTQPLAITFRFFPVDTSGNDAYIDISLQYAIDYPENMFVQESKNVYSITFPSNGYTFATGDETAGNKDLYSNGSTDPLIATSTGKKYKFNIDWTNVILTNELTTFNTMLTSILGKKYTFTLTNNNAFNVVPATVVSSGTYSYTSGA